MRKRRSGQSLVEFSLAFVVFMAMVFAIIDFGRAIYQFNGVSQAAREIARAASVQTGTLASIKASQPVKDAITVQKGLIPYLQDPVFECVDAAGVVVTGVCDYSQDSIRVTIHAPYTAMTPMLGLAGTWDMKGVSSVEVQ